MLSDCDSIWLCFLWHIRVLMKNKIIGLTVMTISYAIAIVIGIFSFLGFQQLGLYFLVSVMIADVLATFFVYLMGVLFRTSSMYDPYWSVQTFVIYACLLSYFNNWSLNNIIILSAMILYSVRLTVNFIIGFDSLKYVDWRYRMLKEKTGPLYQFVNLLGICMFPTFVVYSASIPAFLLAELRLEFNPLIFIGVGIILLGTLLELISDIQMKKFIKTRTDRSQIINVGLWNYSRHPNYLGEIAIWFGLATCLVAIYPSYWYFYAGAIINLIMFLVISIPMEENHMKEYKPGMEEYIRKTSMLLILPRRK